MINVMVVSLGGTWILVKGDVGFGNVDNMFDVNKFISMVI